MNRYKIQCFNKQKQCAFTLLEILVALSMTVLILAAVYGSYRATTTSVSHCKPRSIIEQQARLFLQRLTGELRCSYAGRIDQSEESVFENRSEKEFAHETVRQEESTLFKGEGVFAGKVFLQFITSSFASIPNRNAGGLAIVSYRLDESGKMLLRNVRNYVESYEDNKEDCEWFPVLNNVKTISFEYFEDEKWQKEWKSNDMKILPGAVRISLVLKNDETGPVSFISSAYIMCSRFRNSQAPVQTITAVSDSR